MTTEEGDTHSDQEEGTHQVMTINVVRKDSKKNNYDVIETNSTSNASSEGGVDVEELMGWEKYLYGFGRVQEILYTGEYNLGT